MKKGLPKERFRLLDLGSAITWGLAWVVLASTLATPAASWASLLTGFLGFFIGRKLVGSSLRTPTVALGVLLALPLSYFLLSWPTRSPFLASLFPSPTSLVLVTDFLTWGAAAFLVVGSFQLVSGRYPIFISLEVLIVALCLATPFAAHRDGFINRPYFLIDPLWSRGYDPVPILQGLGILVAVALVLLTIGRATKRSSLLDLILLSLMALTLYLYIPQEALRDLVADPPGSSGLTGEPREAQDDEDGVPPPQGSGAEPMSGSTGGDGDSSDNPFPFETSQKQEPKPVAVVIFRDDYDPPDGYYYFRQTAFSQFNGFRLVKDTTDKADRDLFKRFATQTERVPPPAARFNVRTRKLETRIALISSHKEPFGLVNPVQMTSAPNPKPDQFERAYDVESQVYIGDYSDVLASRLQSSAWSEELKQHYLGYPENDPRYLELAQEIVEIVPEQYRDYPLAMALAITLHLGENGIYTLKPRPVGESEDPTADFLFGDMTGYCVHFSHASVYLMRSLGIPARVAAGYAVEARNRRGSALLIRSSEAHAWPEIWLEGLGWHPLDVSPQTNLDTSDPPPTLTCKPCWLKWPERRRNFSISPRVSI